MLFRTHIVFAVFVFLVFMSFVGNWFVFLFGCLLGAALLDIDSQRSKVGNRWWLRPMQWFVRHRGFVHSLCFVFLLGFVLGLISIDFGFGLSAGGVSHLFLDAFTKKGVRIFWPLKYKIKGFVKSGNWVEDIVFVLLLLFDVFVVGKLLWSI
jgi:inner membrane protein